MSKACLKTAARSDSVSDVTTARLQVGGIGDMKISLGGRYTPNELFDALDRVIQNFTANGVDEFRNITVYLNAYGEERQVLLRDEHTGKLVQHFHYDGPQERIYRPLIDRIRIVDDH